MNRTLRPEGGRHARVARWILACTLVATVGMAVSAHARPMDSGWLLAPALEGALADPGAPGSVDSREERLAATTAQDPGGGAVANPSPEPDAPRRKPKLVPLRDGVHAVKTIFSDAWFVITSPTRMDKQDALVTLGITAVGGVLYAYDKEIEDAVLRSQGQDFYELLVKPGRAMEPVGNMGNTLVYYVSGLAIGYVFQIDPLRELTSTFIESHFVSGGARNIAEITIGRTRPYEGRGARYYQWQGGTSFPSGHASVAMELATILSHHGHSKPFSILCYAAATSLCLERLDSEGHWASDVWFGAVTGHIIARTILTRREKRRLAREQSMGWRESILPFAAQREGATVMGLMTRF